MVTTRVWLMYENDYSWIPPFFAGWMAKAALGGLALSFMRPDRMRTRALWAWLSVPILIAVGLGVAAALYAENIEPYSPIFMVPIFSMILLPPWLLAACAPFALCRYLQQRRISPRS